MVHSSYSISAAGLLIFSPLLHPFLEIRDYYAPLLYFFLTWIMDSMGAIIHESIKCQCVKSQNTTIIRLN